MNTCKPGRRTFLTETISRTDKGQPRPKYIFNKCGTNIYFFYSTEVWSIAITEFLILHKKHLRLDEDCRVYILGENNLVPKNNGDPKINSNLMKNGEPEMSCVPKNDGDP